jgi:hypothetical protein
MHGAKTQHVLHYTGMMECDTFQASILKDSILSVDAPECACVHVHSPVENGDAFPTDLVYSAAARQLRQAPDAHPVREASFALHELRMAGKLRCVALQAERAQDARRGRRVHRGVCEAYCAGMPLIAATIT